MLCNVRAHAVPEEYVRQAGISLVQLEADRVGVADNEVPPVTIAEVAQSAGVMPMPAMVVATNDAAACGSRSSEPGVAIRILTEPVQDLDNMRRAAGRAPGLRANLMAINGKQYGELVLRHRGSSQSVATLSIHLILIVGTG